MKKYKTILSIVFLAITLFCFIGSHGEPVENMNIPVSFGNDIEITPSGKQYISSAQVYTYKPTGEIESKVRPGKGDTVAQTREERQLQSGKKFILGLSQVFVVSEDLAKYSMKDLVSIWLGSAELNDRGICVICKGRAKDILEYKVAGYSNSGEYIKGMVNNLNQFNFFPMQYTVIDVLVRMDAEGRTILLPYIEISKEGIKTTGLAIFNKDKMVAKADMKETRIINLLKENGVKGILTIQKDAKRYLNFYATSKRKVTCTRENTDKYKFQINIYLKGSITTNELYENMTSETKENDKFEEDMASSVKDMCNNTIHTIQNNYKIDVLDLGREAAAKYGKGTGTDWNKIISNSDIEVNVKVNVDTEGRGNY